MPQTISQVASSAGPRPYIGNRLKNLRRVTIRLFKKLQQKINIFDHREKRDVVLDIIGNCNLRCPSCPVGHMGQVNPPGLMDKELFAKVIAKANRDYKVTSVSLFNWTEPLLNPQLPELIEIVNSHYLKCNLSSNLNVLKGNVDDILIAGPHRFRISLSGFTQPVYSKTHVGGNIERVKENMKTLAAALRRTGAQTIVSVYYHKYKNNLHEAAPMREYAESLGFEWQEDWASYMGTEKLIEYMDGGLNPVESKFLDNEFALPIRESLEAAMQFKDSPCKLLKSQLVLDLKGNLLPCCTVYNNRQNALGSYLEMTATEVDRAKRSASACATCASHGIHVYSTHWSHPELRVIYDDLVTANLASAQRDDSQIAKAA